jgi:hypothetical protein
MLSESLNSTQTSETAFFAVDQLLKTKWITTDSTFLKALFANKNPSLKNAAKPKHYAD